jgi:S-adenosylhomocysteine hydrolase
MLSALPDGRAIAALAEGALVALVRAEGDIVKPLRVFNHLPPGGADTKET